MRAVVNQYLSSEVEGVSAAQLCKGWRPVSGLEKKVEIAVLGLVRVVGRTRTTRSYGLEARACFHRDSFRRLVKLTSSGE